jgi:hypothetical protein
MKAMGGDDYVYRMQEVIPEQEDSDALFSGDQEAKQLTMKLFKVPGHHKSPKHGQYLNFHQKQAGLGGTTGGIGSSGEEDEVDEVDEDDEYNNEDKRLLGDV